MLIRTERLVEPRTTYGVGRVQRDLRRGLELGGMVTAVVRDGDANAFTGGVDHTFRWDQNRGSWPASGPAAAPRPTASLQDGFAGLFNFNYNRKYYGVNGHFDRISPNFRNNDIGFLGSRVNKTNINYGFNLFQPDPTRHAQHHDYVYGSQSWNDDDCSSSTSSSATG